MADACKLQRKRELSNIRAKRYYRRHKKERLAYAKSVREANREEYNLSRKKQRRTIQYRFTNLKRTARSRGLAVSLTFDDYVRLVEKNTCNYCGGPLPQVGCGLDRLDHKEGYTIENCVPCCGATGNDCNGKKGALEMIGFTYPRTVELLREVLRDSQQMDAERI